MEVDPRRAAMLEDIRDLLTVMRVGEGVTAPSGSGTGGDVVGRRWRLEKSEGCSVRLNLPFRNS